VSLGFVEGPYLQDLLAQPDAVRAALDGLGEPPLAAAARRLCEPARPVILTGMGSSLYALHVLSARLNRSGRRSMMVETSELVSYAPETLAGALLIVVSQSGRSAEIVRLMSPRPAGCAILAVTNTPGSVLAENADLCLWMRAGQEYSVSSKTYLTTLAALSWLGAILTGESAETPLGEIEAGLPWMREYLARWRKHAERIAARLAPIRHLFLAGRGESLAAAATGGLIIKEAAHFPAEGMSAAAFRHGPIEMLDPATLVVIFSGARDKELNLRLACDIRTGGGQAEIIGEEAELEAFRLPEAPPAARPLLEILPVQMMSLALAALAGREAGRFERAAKVTVVE
jgi:glucosamine--fructose-6-phosphate aminotransferase (isomerizing)